MSASQVLDVQIISSGAVALVPAPEGPALPEGYTAMTAITVGNVPYLCAYNATSSGTDLYAISEGAPFLTLRLRSVRGSLEKETKPPPNAIVSIVSRSPEFRQWARVMLIAVGLDP